MKMRCLAGVALCVMAGWLWQVGSAGAALISATMVDPLGDKTYWYQDQGWPVSIGDHGIYMGTVDANDPSETELGRGGNTGDFWFSYKANAGKQFSQVQVSPVYYDTYGLITVQYKNSSDVWTDVTSTAHVYQGATGAAGWRVWLDTYDFSSFSPAPSEVRVVVSGDTWYPLVSSVKLTVVPEPVTLPLLALGGLMLRRRNRGF